MEVGELLERYNSNLALHVYQKLSAYDKVRFMRIVFANIREFLFWSKFLCLHVNVRM